MTRSPRASLCCSVWTPYLAAPTGSTSAPKVSALCARKPPSMMCSSSRGAVFSDTGDQLNAQSVFASLNIRRSTPSQTLFSCLWDCTLPMWAAAPYDCLRTPCVRPRSHICVRPISDPAACRVGLLVLSGWFHLPNSAVCCVTVDSRSSLWLCAKKAPLASCRLRCKKCAPARFENKCNAENSACL